MSLTHIMGVSQESDAELHFSPKALMGLKSSNPSTGGKGFYCCKIRWNFAALRNCFLVPAEKNGIMFADRADWRLRDEPDMARDAAMK
jgi:hypothetical protein